jgi:hypothetical protein
VAVERRQFRCLAFDFRPSGAHSDSFWTLNATRIRIRCFISATDWDNNCSGWLPFSAEFDWSLKWNGMEWQEQEIDFLSICGHIFSRIRLSFLPKSCICLPEQNEVLIIFSSDSPSLKSNMNFSPIWMTLFQIQCYLYLQ